MKKCILYSIIPVLSWFYSVDTMAQATFVNAGVEVAVPVGEYADWTSFGYGVLAGLETGVGERFAATGTAGVTFMELNETMEWTDNVYLIPIQLGGRYYLDMPRTGLYLELKAGVHLTHSETKAYRDGDIMLEAQSGTKTEFSYAPQIGYFISEAVSVDVRYQGIVRSGDKELYPNGRSLGYVGLRAAYHF